MNVESLADLDALVGRHITGEKPQSHWEDSHAHLHFDSLEEALEALREPYFQQFIPQEDRARTVLREVEEFRCYSADLDVAWEIVGTLGTAKGPIRMWREGTAWHAAFGKRESTSGPTAPIAICLAGLHARGVEVELPPTGFDSHDSASRLAGIRSDPLQPGLLAD